MLRGKQIFLDGNDSGIPPTQRKLLEEIVKKHEGIMVSTANVESINLVRSGHFNASAYKDLSYYDIDWLSKRSEEAMKRSPAKRTRSQSPDNESHPMMKPPFEVPKEFECQRQTPYNHPNKALVSQLERIQRHRYLTGQTRSELSYARAIASLKACPIDISNDLNARHWIGKLPGIGPKIASMIIEYLERSKTAPNPVLSEVQDCWGPDDKDSSRCIEPSQARIRALDELTNIYGVGPSTAARLHDKHGIRSVEQLQELLARSKDHSNRPLGLTAAQLAGLEYFEHFQQRLTREQVAMIADNIRGIMKKLDPDAQLDIVGGYRRGKEVNGDVDILISRPYSSPNESNDSTICFQGGLLKRLVYSLEQEGVLVATLSQSFHRPDEDELDICFCALKGLDGTDICRRVDLVACTYQQHSRMFERSLRRWAEHRCGMRLSSTGAVFTKCGSSPPPLSSEQDLFDLLGLDYIEPEFRNA